MFGLFLAFVWFVFFAALSMRGGASEVITGARTGRPEAVATSLLNRIRSPALLALGIALVPFLYVFGNNCFVTVPPAHVAAVYDPLRGGIQPHVLPEGFHVVMPWWQTQMFSQQTQEYTMSATPHEGAVLGDESIRCQTNEGMNVQVDCTILFHVDPKEADDLWKKIGEDYVLLIVRPYTHNVMRMVVARYSVEDVYTNRRKQIEMEITDAMRPLFAEKGLVLEQVLLRNVQYGNPAFAEAINAKQVAQQQVQTERAKLNRARIEKQTIIAEARGEAEAIRKRGATLRQNPEVVQYEFVQKIAPQLRQMYLPSSALPIMKGGQ